MEAYPAPVPAPPLPFQARSSDEFAPLPWLTRERRALRELGEVAAAAAPRLGLSLAEYCASRTGTAAALLAINRAWGRRYYDVPEEAARDPQAAREALAGDELVVDVQTHYVAPERARQSAAAAVLEFIRSVAPERWRDLKGPGALSCAEYLRCLFLESETAVALLTAAPGEGEHNVLTNGEIAATRQLVDRLAGSGRLLHHAIVHPNLPGELDALERTRDRFRPAGWKVYTLYAGRGAAGTGWRLDDPQVGRPFLERSRALGVDLVCAHKGFSRLAPTGSPADVGPAAAAFPELRFLIYHSGYEAPLAGEEEGPYSPAGPHAGTDRLLASLERAGIGPGANVYAELGSTWFCLMRRPREAVHVLGKLLRAVGEERVLWGTDSIWYGSPQPLIDAFRAFRIPDEDCERFGYPPLTPARKARILGLNAAEVYGIDVAAVRARVASDDLAWARASLEELRGAGTPRL